MMDPLSYIYIPASAHPCCYTNRLAHQIVKAVFFSRYLNGPLPYARHYITVRKCFINDALNTFYLRLYGVKHMVRDHSDSEKGNPLLFLISSKGSFICTIPQTG